MGRSPPVTNTPRSSSACSEALACADEDDRRGSADHRAAPELIIADQLQRLVAVEDRSCPLQVLQHPAWRLTVGMLNLALMAAAGA